MISVRLQVVTKFFINGVQKELHIVFWLGVCFTLVFLFCVCVGGRGVLMHSRLSLNLYYLIIPLPFCLHFPSTRLQPCSNTPALRRKTCCA